MTKPKVIVAVPWRSDGGGRRAELWKFTRAWIEKHHDYRIITSDCDPGPFNRGQAINRAAAEGGDWDVLIVWDADNIADPMQVEAAVQRAQRTQTVVMPYEVYVYLDEYSSDRLMANNGQFTFLAPLVGSPTCCNSRDHWYNHSVLHHHHSGVQIFPRRAFEQVGGFIEFTGWGYEDSVMSLVLRVFDNGITWLEGSALHLFHEHAFHDKLSPINHTRWRAMNSYAVNPRRLRQLLADEGHVMPESR